MLGLGDFSAQDFLKYINVGAFIGTLGLVFAVWRAIQGRIDKKADKKDVQDLKEDIKEDLRVLREDNQADHQRFEETTKLLSSIDGKVSLIVSTLLPDHKDKKDETKPK